jgi:hypothetical protein
MGSEKRNGCIWHLPVRKMEQKLETIENACPNEGCSLLIGLSSSQAIAVDARFRQL